MRFTQLTDRLVRALQDIQPDDVLASIGLERRRGTVSQWLPLAGALVGGIAIGVGIGLAFAPMSGQDLRKAIAGKASALRSRVGGGRRTAKKAPKAAAANGRTSGRNGKSAADRARRQAAAS